MPPWMAVPILLPCPGCWKHTPGLWHRAEQRLRLGLRWSKIEWEELGHGVTDVMELSGLGSLRNNSGVAWGMKMGQGLSHL